MNLIEADIVVADLTDHNPNVFWELGVRHSFTHGTVTVAEEGTIIPFDIKDRGVLFYDVGHLNESFKEIFKKAIIDCCDHPEKPDSPVLESISGRGTLYNIINSDKLGRRVQSLISELNYNKNHMNKLVNLAKKNLEITEKGESYELIQAPMESSCIKLLVVNRYLERDSDFYEHAMKCLREYDAINSTLPLWGTTEGKKHVEEWLVKREEKTVELIENMLKLLM